MIFALNIGVFAVALIPFFVEGVFLPLDKSLLLRSFVVGSNLVIVLAFVHEFTVYYPSVDDILEHIDAQPLDISDYSTKPSAM